MAPRGRPPTLLTYNAITLPVYAWAAWQEIPYTTVIHRHVRWGWPWPEALELVPHERGYGTTKHKRYRYPQAHPSRYYAPITAGVMAWCPTHEQAFVRGETYASDHWTTVTHGMLEIAVRYAKVGGCSHLIQVQETLCPDCLTHKEAA